jgi:hypothetical protein
MLNPWDEMTPDNKPPVDPGQAEEKAPGSGINPMAVISLLPMIFGGKGKPAAAASSSSSNGLLNMLGGPSKPSGQANASDMTQYLQQVAGQTGQQGAQLYQTGSDALAPLIQYLTALVGGDETALAQAIQPEAASVLSQYDTAKRAISEFSPRGGGRTAALSQLPMNAANQISALTNKSRTEAAGTLANLGTTLTGQGIGGESAAMSTLASLIGTMTAKDAASQAAWTGVLGDIGSAAMTYYLYKSGK